MKFEGNGAVPAANFNPGPPRVNCAVTPPNKSRMRASAIAANTTQMPAGRQTKRKT
jgi:hypothetical protein